MSLVCFDPSIVTVDTCILHTKCTKSNYSNGDFFVCNFQVFYKSGTSRPFYVGRSLHIYNANAAGTNACASQEN